MPKSPFSTLLTHFSHFRVWWRFEGAAKTARNDQKCSFFLKTAGKHTYIARITHQNGPKHPESRVIFFCIFTFPWHFAKNNLSRNSWTSLTQFQVIYHLSGLRRVTKNDQKWPKMAQNVPKHVQKPSGIIFENIDFWWFLAIFRPLWPISVIFGSGGVLRGLQKRQEMTKNANFS